MSKFKKGKQGDLPAISTASLPDIVFMLLFFFMVATVMRDSSLMIENRLPSADQVEKLKKDRTAFIYAGKPSAQFKQLGTEPVIQFNDKIIKVEEVQSSVLEAQRELTEELQPKFVVGLKVDKDTHAGLVSDIKQELRKANTLKVMYIANARAE
ncbi:MULTISPECIES: ExbD/TolR family protein [Winogradskyella]|jgi:biopolymer transport protein ExbD|uniref:ExbD/TolR family protein n=1 Tax=Winogradskyella TaxID=286104 RepID=UPI000C5E6859|nr:biopolymer transporter ExbD [Winogradskyella sp. MH6]MAB48430.1 biopolymer transporter ExbD [Flavobacteriaceae bacterium]MBD10196.1 biopolymer transporter ExbD [Flavobacteriaceae bacterium]|tara:strand:- start:95 stop:556 length:462 start_codon:yes stop_codon:yes gene_type:complete